MTIGPARVRVPSFGPIEVLHGDKLIKTFGDIRRAQGFAEGYNTAWHRRGAEADQEDAKAASSHYSKERNG